MYDELNLIDVKKMIIYKWAIAPKLKTQYMFKTETFRRYLLN